jgi:hypothetical protein
VRATLLTPNDEEEYTIFLSRHRARMLYYMIPYRDLLQAHLGCEAQYFIARDSHERIRGLLPTMVRRGKYGIVVNSLPFFGSHGGVLADSPEAEQVLWNTWNDVTGVAAAATVILNPFGDQAPPVVSTHCDYRIGSMTPLREQSSVEDILSQIDSSAKRNYRKASRLGVRVDEDNTQVETLHSIHAENMAAIGGRAKDLSFFQEISRHFVPGRDFKIYVASYEGETAAALLVFFCGACAEYFTPGTRLAVRDLQPSALLLVRAMHDAAKAGFRQWNWGGSWVDQQSVARFKGKWGGQALEYRYYTRVNTPDILAVPTEALLREYPNFYVYPFTNAGAKTND